MGVTCCPQPTETKKGKGEKKRKKALFYSTRGTPHEDIGVFVANRRLPVVRSPSERDGHLHVHVTTHEEQYSRRVTKKRNERRRHASVNTTRTRRKGDNCRNLLLLPAQRKNQTEKKD